MLANTTVVTDYSVDEYLEGDERFVATSLAGRSVSIAPNRFALTRSFVGSSPIESSRPTGAIRTAISDRAPIVIGPKRASDGIIRELAAFRKLTAGWDGEQACAPNADAVTDAIHFAHAAATVYGFVPLIQPSLHADGSVILEIDGSRPGSLSFLGDGRIVFSVDGGPSGLTDFQYDIVPEVIKAAFLA